MLRGFQNDLELASHYLAQSKDPGSETQLSLTIQAYSELKYCHSLLAVINDMDQLPRDIVLNYAPRRVGNAYIQVPDL